MAQAVPVLIQLAVVAGGMAAQYFLTPKPKTPDPIDVGKYDDPRITGSEYGAFIPRWWGTVRTAGNIIWSAGVDHTIIDYPSEGGKGGTPPSPATRVHVYTSSFGMLIGRSQVEEWGRIWADENLIVGKVGDNVKVFQAEDTEVATPSGERYDEWDYQINNGNTYLIFRKRGGVDQDVLFDVSSCELPPLQITNDPDEVVTVSPRTKVTFYYGPCGPLNLRVSADTGAGIIQRDINPIYSTQWGVVRTLEFEGDLESVQFINRGTTTPLGDEFFRLDKIIVEKYWHIDNTAQGNEFLGSVTGLADPDAIYAEDSDNLSGFYSFVPTPDAQGTSLVSTALAAEAFRLYSGTETQLRDSYLSAYLDTKYGIGNGLGYTPALRGLSWISFNNYGLRRGRVPNLTVEVSNDFTAVNDVLTAMAADVGFTESDLRLDLTSGYSFYGYLESQNNSRKAHWESLGAYFGFRFAEIDGKLVTINDEFVPIDYLDNIHIRATDGSDQPKPYDAEIIRLSPYELPREVRFTTSNPDLDYLKETAVAALVAAPELVDVVEMSFPLVATQEQTRRQAESMLLRMHSETKTAKFTAMPTAYRYTVGDILTTVINGQEVILRIDRKTTKLPLGVVEIDATLLDPFEAGDIQSSIVPTQVSSLASAQTAFLSPPRNAVAIPIISLPIRTSDKGRLGVYIAVSPFGKGVAETVSLYQEIADETFTLREIYEVPSVVGVSLDALGNHTDEEVEDTTNVLDIYFFNDETLETAATEDLERNPQLNLIRVGSEWVQFRTATLQTLDPASSYRSKWRISNLMRGRFGTSAAMSSHTAEEYCVLNTNNLRFYDLNEADIGETVTFAAVSGGANLEASPKSSFVFNPISSYAVSNGTDTRTIDADCTTIDELADVVATIIKDTNL